ncbi:MAG: hypothetical protein CMG69_00770 [Candidatus Marinimicrobia bacterium]|nr:hypothetical protein [Candidatus Neomarinimicrobiota bacterium]|tara:strand:- start:25666 stop:28095 length:2430 start_codon:yes stop_codon:yes gene_type:complete
MINDRILPWTQDQETQGYPVWTTWEALQRTVFFLNTMGEIDTSFNITPYDPNSPEDFAYIKNLILELRDTTQHNLIAVPHDYPTIQEGIDAATSGDTVLVSPGIYFENIDFNGKNIIIGSQFLTTQDTSYVSQTIIDGSNPLFPDSGSVVIFKNGENLNAKLSGFTLQNGSGTLGFGGGNNFTGGAITIYQSSPNLEFLKIKDNTSDLGGGIYCREANPLISNVNIKYNYAEGDGGGISLRNGSNPIINNSIICFNQAEYGGGAIRALQGSDFTIQNCLIYNNLSGFGIVYLWDSSMDMTNTTMVSNEETFLHLRGYTNTKIINSIVRNHYPGEELTFYDLHSSSQLTFLYNNLDFTEEDINNDYDLEINWEVGNISEDPNFSDPYFYNYNLEIPSSCIDSGHPDLDGDGYSWDIDPDDRDPDETRMDMGAFYHHHSAGNFPISVSYNEGWNMVGLPLLVEDGHYQSLFNSIYSGSLYNFDGMYIVEEYLDEGFGYLLRFTENTQVNFEGTHMLDIIIPVEGGWNLISGLSTLTSVDEVYSSSIIYPGTIYGFEGTYVNADYIVPGRGYWVRAMHDGEIILSSASLAVKMIEQVDHLSRVNTLKISNGDYSTTLFFGKNVPKGKKLNYSLPPIFPQMPFDARFSGDTKVVLESGSIEVLSQLETLTVDYDIKIIAGEKMNWVLITEDGIPFILEGTGKFTVLSVERFTLDRISQLPKKNKLKQNFPNPFNNKTSIHYYIPINTHVIIQIYNLNGAIVKTLINNNQLAGHHKVNWNGHGRNNNIVSSGIYIYKLNTRSGQSLTGKCIFLK